MRNRLLWGLAGVAVIAAVTIAANSEKNVLRERVEVYADYRANGGCVFTAYTAMASNGGAGVLVFDPGGMNREGCFKPWYISVCRMEELDDAGYLWVPVE